MGLVGWLLWSYGALVQVIWLAVCLVVLTGAAIALASWTTPTPAGRLRAVLVTSAQRVDAVPPSAVDFRLIRLRRDVRDTVERDDRPDALYAHIEGLTVDRMLTKHGLDLRRDWQTAVRLMHPDLADYLAHPDETTRRQNPRRIETVVARIEEL